MFSVLNPFPLTYPKFPPDVPDGDSLRTLDTMPHPHFHGKKSSCLKNTVWVSDLGIIHYGYVNANSSKLSTKVSNSSCAFLLLLVKTV
jgi:hypothetical protein